MMGSASTGRMPTVGALPPRELGVRCPSFLSHGRLCSVADFPSSSMTCAVPDCGVYPSETLRAWWASRVDRLIAVRWPTGLRVGWEAVQALLLARWVSRAQLVGFDAERALPGLRQSLSTQSPGASTWVAVTLHGSYMGIRDIPPSFGGRESPCMAYSSRGTGSDDREARPGGSLDRILEVEAHHG
jgi:hypothetical protein